MNISTLPSAVSSDLIFEGSNSLIYYEQDNEIGKPVIVKILREEHPTSPQIIQFKSEYEFTKDLTIEGIRQAYQYIKIADKHALLLEYVEGETVKKVFVEQKRSLADFLSVAIQIAQTLGDIHRHHIIHKDINGNNILVNRDDHRIKIIDFGISSRIDLKMQHLGNPAVLEGTLPYISPEQTGRMNRVLDYRTDLYSLGVTFYEMLTGRLPFETQDAMELVHSHIAKRPRAVCEVNPQIPQMISHIVMKLMAKNAEERYQSAYGLKADLERCLKQWQERGHIEAFALGGEDFSGKFQIPEKLYGREEQIEMLQAAFERVSQGQSQLMLVAGYSGIGKSALVHEIHKPITQKRGFFISGKFDQFQRNIPYSAVVQALQELVKQLLTQSEEELTRWREKLQAAFGPNGQVICDVIPELELIVGAQPAIRPLAPMEAKNRFNLVFQSFIRLFCQPEHPLVIFLDDLQWADSASLKLIELMMSDEESHYLFLMGAYRDNEVSASHPLMMTLEKLGPDSGLLSQIVLKPLTFEHITELMTDSLHQEPESVQPLAELVMSKTEGNPFFVNEFLKNLYQEGLLTFDVVNRRWQWDIVKIEAMQITDNVVELMVGKLRKLPLHVQEVLSLAACIGSQFDLDTLTIISKKSLNDTFELLMKAVQEGLIWPTSERQVTVTEMEEAQLLIHHYKFSHDRVREAAYALLDQEEKKALHLKIGRLLYDLPPAERAERLFEVIDHLNQGAELVTAQAMRHNIAALNLTAGQKAKAAMAYQPALNYLRTGREFLIGNNGTSESWQSQYGLTLALSEELVEVEYLNANLQQAEKVGAEILQYATSLLERIKVYEYQIQFDVYQNRQQAAINTAIEVLKMLDISLPLNEHEMWGYAQQLYQEVRGIESIAALEDLPVMTDPYQKAAMRVLMKATSAAFQSNPALMPSIVFTMVKLCLTYGNSPLSAYAYGLTGVILAAFYADFDSGYQFGQLSQKILAQFNATDLLAKIECMFNVSVRHWKEHARETMEPLNDAIQAGIEHGDVEYAFHNAIQYGLHSFFIGEPLEVAHQKHVKFLEMMEVFHSDFHTDQVYIREQMIKNLRGESSDPTKLVGAHIDESLLLPLWMAQQRMLLVFLMADSQLILRYLFGDYALAVQAGELASNYQQSVPGNLCLSEHNFYYSLALLAHYEQVDKATQERYLTQVAANQEKMQLWARHAPSNHQHKLDLVAAEQARLLGEPLKAMQLYDDAIQGARAQQYIQEEALAYERAAEFYQALGREEIAQSYMSKAHYAYKMWGAKAKVKQLEQRNPYLSPRAWATVHITDTQTRSHSAATGTSVLEALDLATVIKASQTISGEIVLSKLLEDMMQLVIENAGAQRGLLILQKAKEWVIEAKANTNQIEVLQSIPIKKVGGDSTTPLVSRAIVNLVARSRQNVVLHDASQQGQFRNDPYVLCTQPKSILCLPLINQGKVSGILYLENNLSTNAFTPDRLATLKLLSSQMAISLDNAALYDDLQRHRDHLEELVSERTHKLSQTLEHLKATQAQLIESEKMAALGSLVAGVAHEINTPVGIGVTAASTLENETQTLLAAYKTGLKRSDLKTYIKTAMQCSQLILSNLERAAKLVHSFKQVAVDQTSLEKRAFTVKNYLEATLRSLAPHLKPTKHTIQIIGDEEITLNSYPGAFSQIATNLVMNSISHAYKAGEVGQLSFKMTDKNERILIEYSDDGCGIPEEHLPKIFEPFFTTARYQGGTGLGLHIVYNLVTQKLDGTIRCESQVGKGTKFIIDLPIQSGG
jgi:predicted ATPase/signal transduction histidine kinase/tRNA A-37 threonylcarbamoyl transferase component Bud32